MNKSYLIITYHSLYYERVIMSNKKSHHKIQKHNHTPGFNLVTMVIILVLILPILNLGLLIIQDNSTADQTVPAKTIIVDTLWGTDNYIINGDITIANNANLTIAKRSTLKFNGAYTIYVDGGLIIDGTGLEKVLLIPNDANPSPGFWGGIRVNSTGFIRIKFAEIQYATNGIYLDQAENSTIKSTSVKYSSNSGVVCDSTNNITLSNNSFSENLDTGLHLISAENTSIKYNTINTNEVGINVSGSKNTYLGNNSLSNRLQNAYDDDTSSLNDWNSNYYNDYIGADDGSGLGDIGDFIGDSANYGLNPGFNQDLKPRTKIFNTLNSKTYASLTKAVSQSAGNMIIVVPATTPNAGSQTLNQTGYFYENFVIDFGLGNDVTIIGEGINKVILDGNAGTCIEVKGNYSLTIDGVSIANSDKGIYIQNNAANCALSNLSIKNNNIGVMVDQVRDSTIKKCIFNNNGTAGLVLENSQMNLVENCSFNSGNYGILISNSKYNSITRSSCNQNLKAGILLNHSSNNEINKTQLISCLDTGLMLVNESNNNTFFNNVYNINLNGIKLYGSKFNQFQRSEIKANQHWGILFENHSDNNTFEGIGNKNFLGSDISVVAYNSSNNMFKNSTVFESLTSLVLWMDYNSSIIFLNSKFYHEGVAFQDSQSKIIVQYYLTVRAVNKTNSPISEAFIKVLDNKTNLIASGLTNELGEIPLIVCLSYIRNQTKTDYSSNNHILNATDGISNLTTTINISITNYDPKVFIRQFKFNYFPLIITQDNITAKEKVFYSMKYEALNFERNKNITWELKTNTSFWLQLDAENGTINGTPHNRDVGRPWVNITVRDSDGDPASHNFTLIINNTEPTIITKNQITAYEDNLYSVDYNSTDDDGYFNDTGVLIFPAQNRTTWRFNSNAKWLLFNNETGLLNGTPLNNHVGNYNVKVFVDDGNGGQNQTSFVLTVINTPPEIITADIDTAYKNLGYYNDYNSSDDGQGFITWFLETNASWLMINSENGTLNGTPMQDDVGLWWVNISVLDDHGGITSHNFTLKVIDLNQPPSITTENVRIAYANRLYSVNYEAEDQDTSLQNLTWEVETNATWLNIDFETGLLSGTPLLRHVGWYWVNVTVLDNEGGKDFANFILTVIRLNNTAPSFIISTLIPDNEKTIEAYRTWEHTFEAEDDYTSAEELIWSLKTDANWLTINSSSGEVFGKPESKNVGRYWVNVTVTDGEGLFNFTNFTLIVRHTNSAPHLSHGGMTPKNGTNQDWFTFYVTYTDADNDSGSVYVVIDNVSHAMKPSGVNYDQGVNYTFRIKLGPGEHTYYFKANDAWDLEATLAKDVPSKDKPAITNKIKEVIIVPFYMQPMCWAIAIVIVILLLCVLQFVLKPLSKRYPKMEFVNRITLPDRINPLVQYQLRQEREESGDFGFLCPMCKSVVEEEATKCENCGERFTVMEYQCPYCQAEVAGDDLFCPKCGSKFEELDEDELKELELGEEEPVEEELEAEEPEAEEPKEDEPEEGEPEEGKPKDELPDEETKEIETKVARKVKPILRTDKLAAKPVKVLPAAKVVTPEKHVVKKVHKVEKKPDDTEKDTGEDEQEQEADAEAEDKEQKADE